MLCGRTASYIREVLQGRKDLGDLLDGLSRGFGMLTSLKEVGVEGEEKLKTLSLLTMEDLWCRTNPCPLTQPSQVMDILEVIEK